MAVADGVAAADALALTFVVSVGVGYASLSPVGADAEINYLDQQINETNAQSSALTFWTALYLANEGHLLDSDRAPVAPDDLRKAFAGDSDWEKNYSVETGGGRELFDDWMTRSGAYGVSHHQSKVALEWPPAVETS